VHGARPYGETMEAYLIATGICFAAIWLLSDLSYRFVEMPGRKFVVDLLVPKKSAPS
jgi:peptidoglycan/LPS O-acetylase OafA/YrhL